MAVLETLVEGQTEQIVEQLFSTVAGVKSAVSLTGIDSLHLIIHDSLDNEVTLTGDYGIKDAATGKVYVNFADGDLDAAVAPLQIHWKVIDGTGKVSFFPAGARAKWEVYKA